MTRNKWKKAVLGDLIKISHGYPFKSRHFSLEPTNRVLITPGNFKRGGGFNAVRLKYYKENAWCPCDDEDSTKPRYVLEPGDIIIPLTDLGRAGDILGCSARVPDLGNKIILHNQRIGKISVLSEDLSPRFLYWLLRTVRYRRHVLGAASGTTVRHTTPSVIKSYGFYLPPIECQEEIAGILDLLEARIELLELLNKSLETWVLKIYGQWFPGVRRRAALSHFGNIVCGKTPSKGVSHYFNGSIPFIKIPDMRDKVYVTATRDSLTPEGAATQRSRELPPHSVCVSCIATVGLVTLTSSRCYTNQQINSIIPYHAVYRYYLYCTLKKKSMVSHLRMLGKGGTSVLNINTYTFSRVRIPYPPEQRLKAFYKETHDYFQLILSNTQKAEKFAAYVDYLLPRFMSGRHFRVKRAGGA